MHGIKNKRGQNLEKPIPGCMGRMVNLFDFGPGVPGNRLLADKAHREGPGNREDFARMMLDPAEAHTEDIHHELRRSSHKKSNGTPMKMLIAREMSKETESKQRPPNVVAKLMGLDALPGQQQPLNLQRSAKVYSQNSFSQSHTNIDYWPRESDFLDKQVQFESRTFNKHREYKDTYKAWQQAPENDYLKDNLPQSGRHKEQQDEAKMDLVRQKFIQAKRLATDEKLRQSKEFQDALEVLSSNKDLFLKFLQEPNSLFSQHLCELQSIPPPSQTNRITVLRPSKTNDSTGSIGCEKKNETQMQRPRQAVETYGWDKSKPSLSPLFSNQKENSSSQPTRIVVLKPSPGKTHDIKDMVSSPKLSPRLLQKNELYEVDDEARCSREVAKEITRQMRESLSSHRREDTILSSVFSNGYVGDDSSFNRSENENTGEGTLSDLEVMTPTSRHSWDYINRFGSPQSSSFSRASYSPESSVCREAKKRLSERWAMMTSNYSGQEQRQVRRSSSTLAEMLALSESKKSAGSREEAIEGRFAISSSRSCGGEQDLREPASSSSSGREKDEDVVESPKNLLRSRSVPVSSTAYGSRLNIEVPNSDHEVGKSNVAKGMEKSRSGKSSFKGKVSSLFFSRNKKPSKDKSKTSHQASLNEEVESAPVDSVENPEQSSPAEASDRISRTVTTNILDGGQSLSPGSSSSKASPLASTELTKGTFSHQGLLSAEEQGMPGNQMENQDQPSPISVLEASFEDENSTSQLNEAMKTGLQGQHMCLKSNFISKSPPIESLARSLSWDDACSDAAIPDPLNSSLVSSESEEQEWYSFVHLLLSSVGLNCNDVSNTSFVRWHSTETPLDPSLLEKFFNQKEDKEQRYEAKRRQRRSTQKLIFDSVNAALVDMIQNKSNPSPWIGTSISCGSHGRISPVATVTVEEVWNRVKGWFSSEPKCCFLSETGDYSILVESMVKQEVVGVRWMELMRLEVDGVGTEIEREMLEELVEEALFELTGSFS